MKSVFISSTFKDMQAERDLLHERIFPRLRKVIGEYGEDIQELDLRWGVDTAEMSEEESGHLVLRVCIDAIDRCRPYIIVLLGERYGWIPELELVESLRDERVNAWYEKQMSITNLEIRYGAFSEEETLRKCVFCFRDPKLTEEIDEGNRSLYDAESPMHREKLNALKEQIRAKRDAVILDYDAGWDAERGCVCGLEAFGEALYEQLVQMVRRDFAGQEAKNPQEKLFLQMERMKEQYLSSYVVRYREEFEAFRLIAEYHKEKGRIYERYLDRVILRGEAGSGKSALMASVEHTLHERGYETILYFSGNSGCQSMDVLKDYVIYRLEEICGLPHDGQASRDDRLRFLSDRTQKKKIYCFIDAVDQLLENKKDQRLDILDLCPNLYYVLSALSDFPVEESVKTYVWPFSICQIEDLTLAERRSIIHATASKRGKKLDDIIVEMTVREPGAGNPLYLSMLLQRYFMMNQKEFEAAETLSPGMEGLHRYMEKLLAGMPDQAEPMAEYLFQVTGQRFGLDWFQEILRLLAVSRYGLSEKELEGILSAGGMRFLQVEFQQLVSYLYDAFACREDGKWIFAHRLFEEAVLHGMGDGDREAAWKLLIDHSLQSPAFLEQEGFYYILEKRHPAGRQVIELSGGWRTKSEVMDLVGSLTVRDKESRAYFLEISRSTQSDALDEFWLSFDPENYTPEFGGFLSALWKELSKKDSALAERKYQSAINLANYFHRREAREEAFLWLQEAEKFCGDMSEPVKSRRLSHIYALRGMWYIRDSRGKEWEKSEEEFERALERLKPWLQLEDLEERKKVLEQDFRNKANYAEFFGTFRKDFRTGMLEGALKELERFEEETSDDSLERWKVDLCGLLNRAYRSGEYFDIEKSLAYGQRAMEVSEKLVKKDPGLQNMRLRLGAVENYAGCFDKGFRYPWLEQYLLLIRNIYGRYPTLYWKEELAYSACAFADAMDYAVLNRSNVFPADLRNEAEKAWEEGFLLYEELMKTDPAQNRYRYDYEFYLVQKAGYDEEKGYNKQALQCVKRAREILDEIIRMEGDFDQKEKELRDMDLTAAKALCGLCRFQEALPYAAESVEMALKRQEQRGKIFRKTAEAYLVYTRILYYLRRDEEALRAAEEPAKIHTALGDDPESKTVQKTMAEINYIRGRIYLEQGRLSETAECLEAFERFCREKKDSWKYGQSLMLRGDLLAAGGELEKAGEVFEKAYSFWVDNSDLEKRRRKSWFQYTVYREGDRIYRRDSRTESGYYMRSVCYQLYSLYRKNTLADTWDGELKTVLAHVEEFWWDSVYAEWVWLPANFPVFERLTAMVPENVKEKWMPEDLKNRGRTGANMEERAKQLAVLGEKEPSLCSSILKETGEFFREIVNAYFEYHRPVGRSEKLSEQFLLSTEEAVERACVSEKERWRFADRRLSGVRAFYLPLKPLEDVYRRKEHLTREEEKELYRLVRDCFAYHGWDDYREDMKAMWYFWDVSSLSDSVLELVSAAFDDEKEAFWAGRLKYMDAKKICTLELYGRTGDRAYIDRHLQAMSEFLDLFLLNEDRCQEREGVSNHVAYFLWEALKQGGAGLAGRLFDFLKEYGAVKEAMSGAVLEELRKNFMEVLGGQSDKGAFRREQAEEFWQAGYRIKREETLKRF